MKKTNGSLAGQRTNSLSVKNSYKSIRAKSPMNKWDIKEECHRKRIEMSNELIKIWSRKNMKSLII